MQLVQRFWQQMIYKGAVGTENELQKWKLVKTWHCCLVPQAGVWHRGQHGASPRSLPHPELPASFFPSSLYRSPLPLLNYWEIWFSVHHPRSITTFLPSFPSTPSLVLPEQFCFPASSPPSGAGAGVGAGGQRTPMRGRSWGRGERTPVRGRAGRRKVAVQYNVGAASAGGEPRASV